MYKPRHISEMNLMILIPQITEKFGTQFVETLIDYLESEGTEELLDILVELRDVNISVAELNNGIRFNVE